MEETVLPGSKPLGIHTTLHPGLEGAFPVCHSIDSGNGLDPLKHSYQHNN